MNPVVRRRILNSMEHVGAGTPHLDANLARRFHDFAPGGGHLFALNGSVAIAPILFADNNSLQCVQSGFFGFYSLREAIRSVLMAINYIVASEASMDASLFGPAVALSYTSAFHALHGLLALEGRVYLGSFTWIPTEPGDEFPTDKCPLGVLTKDGEWIYERRSRGHTVKWLEVKTAFAKHMDRLPKCFEVLFDAEYAGQFRRDPGVPIVEMLKNPSAFRVRMSDKFDEFLARIADARHEALYASFGEDSGAASELWDGEPIGADALGRHARSFALLAHQLVHHVVVDVLSLLHEIPPTAPGSKLLDAAVHLPWFDRPRLDQISDEALRHHAKEVNAWLLAALRGDGPIATLTPRPRG